MNLRSKDSSITPLEAAILACDKEDNSGFEVRFINDYIGRGAFTTKKRAKGEFLLEYKGELITNDEGIQRQNSYSSSVGNFLYFFTYKGFPKCIDATHSGGACRMVNDGIGKQLNSVMRVVPVNDVPHLCLFALRDIREGEELRFDYGDSSVHWRKKEVRKITDTSAANLDQGKVNRWEKQLLDVQNSVVSCKQIGRIRFSKHYKIANGSNGSQVFLGLVDDQTPVAVKRLPEDIHPRDRELMDILNKQVNFQNILKTVAVEEDEDFAYIATPLCDFNLEERIETQDFTPLSKTERKEMCVQLMRALGDLHSLDILHRDLKPSNVLIDKDGKLLLADFGVARQMKSGTTLLTKALGTMCWMNPNSFTDDTVRYKKSSDVQMMGCLMYYILTNGHIPHETVHPYSKDPQGVLRNMKDGVFSLKYLGDFHNLRTFFQRILHIEENHRPSVQECLSYFRDNEAKVDITLSPSLTPRCSACFVLTGLSSQQKEKVQLLAEITGSRIMATVGESTTHVVTRTDNKGKCETTLKVLQGIAGGLWMMEYAWVTQSLKHGYLLQEERFEVEGDDGGPRRARLWTGDPLLHNFNVTVIGKSLQMPKEMLQQLLRNCGATVSESGIPVDCSSFIIDLCDPETRDKTSLEGITKMTPVLHFSWLVETIVKYRVQPYETYIVDILQTGPEMGEDGLCEEQTGQQADVLEQQNYSNEDDAIYKENLPDADTEDPLDPDYRPPDEVESLPDSDEHSKDTINIQVNEVIPEPSLTNTGKEEASNDQIQTGQQADVLEQQNYSNEDDAIYKENLPDADTEDPLDPDYRPPDEVESLPDSDEHSKDTINIQVNEVIPEPSLTNTGKEEASNDQIQTGQQADVLEQQNYSDEDDVMEKEDLSDADTEDPLDPDYRPPDEVESLPDSDEHSKDTINIQVNEVIPEPSLTNTGKEEASNDQIVSDGEDEDESEGEDPSSTYVLDSKSRSKYSYCLYCSIPQRKLPRHCARKHRKEFLVEEALAECNYEEKRAKWLHIRKLGNHEHNHLVFSGKAKDLVVRRRPMQSSSSIFIYVPCLHCYGYYHRQSLWIHVKNCPKKNKGAKGQSNYVKEGLKIIGGRSETSPALKCLLSKMVHDKVSIVIRNDEDILRVGETTLSTSNSRRKGDKAREKMRLLAKLLEQARLLDPEVKRAQDLVHPSRFELVVSAAKLVSGYDEEKGTHKSYSCALNIGFAVSDLAMVVKNKYVKEQRHKKIKEVDGFIYLRSTEWRSQIIAPAHRQKQEMAWKAPKLLPLTEDCVKFNLYLKSEEKKVKEEIKKDGTISFSTYKRFASITLAQIILYNRRRPSEVAEMTVSDYKDQTTKEATIHDEIMQSLSAPEKVSLKRSTLLMVRGKRGRGVPILLPQNLKESTDMLALHNSGKKYLFSRAGEESATPLRAYQVIADLAEEPDLQDPSSIRCTKLRKHLATLSQLLSLKKNELEQLANHLGHDVSTHREYYRLPSETILLAKMSKLLCLTEEGRLHEFKGKSLQEISVAQDELVTVNADADADAEESDSSEHVDIDEEAEASNKVEEDQSHQSLFVKSKRKKKVRLYNRWTPEQEMYLMKQREIQVLLKEKQVPGKSLCLLLISRSNGILGDKRWQHVKNKVHNMNTSEKLKLKKRTTSVA